MPGVMFPHAPPAPQVLSSSRLSLLPTETPEQFPPEGLLATIVLVTVAVPPLKMPPPKMLPPSTAVLPDRVLLMTVSVAEALFREVVALDPRVYEPAFV